jgi:hypothetical protein
LHACVDSVLFDGVSLCAGEFLHAPRVAQR